MNDLAINLVNHLPSSSPAVSYVQVMSQLGSNPTNSLLNIFPLPLIQDVEDDLQNSNLNEYQSEVKQNFSKSKTKQQANPTFSLNDEFYDGLNFDIVSENEGSEEDSEVVDSNEVSGQTDASVDITKTIGK